jgi:hypothetical protein
LINQHLLLFWPLTFIHNVNQASCKKKKKGYHI